MSTCFHLPRAARPTPCLAGAPYTCISTVPSPPTESETTLNHHHPYTYLTWTPYTYLSLSMATEWPPPTGISMSASPLESSNVNLLIPQAFAHLASASIPITVSWNVLNIVEYISANLYWVSLSLSLPILLYYIVLYSTLLFYTMIYYNLLYYTILYYSLLYYITVCYTIL